MRTGSKGYGESRFGAAIQIKGTKLGHTLAEGRGQRRIRIENNRIVDAPGAAIFVGAAQDVLISENRIEASPATPAPRATGAILLANCASVVIESCTVVDPRSETTAAVEILSSADKGEVGVRVAGLRAELAKGAAPVADRQAP